MQNTLGNRRKNSLSVHSFFHATDQHWQRALELEQVFYCGKNCDNPSANTGESKKSSFYLVLVFRAWHSPFWAVLGLSSEGESFPRYNKSLSHLSNSPSSREKLKMDGGKWIYPHSYLEGRKPNAFLFKFQSNIPCVKRQHAAKR